MRSIRLAYLSAAYLWLSAAPSIAQSAGEQIGPLPIQLDPGRWALLKTLKPAITDFLVLPGGTPVTVEFVTFVTTRTAKPKDRVKLQVVSDVSVEGLTVIPKGSVAWGTVIFAKKPSHFSRGGQLQIELASVTLLNGQFLAIRNHPLARTRTGKWTLNSPDSLQAPLLIPVAAGILAVSSREERQAFAGSVLEGFLAKGHDSELLPGTRVEAVIPQTVELNRQEFSKLQPAPSTVLGTPSSDAC